MMKTLKKVWGYIVAYLPLIAFVLGALAAWYVLRERRFPMKEIALEMAVAQAKAEAASMAAEHGAAIATEAVLAEHQAKLDKMKVEERLRVEVLVYKNDPQALVEAFIRALKE